VDDRRVISGIFHMLKSGVVGATARPTTNHRRPCTIGSTVGQRVTSGCSCSTPGGSRRGNREHRHRQHVHQRPALRVRRKRGARAQAIGRSRSGKTTKIHALTDVASRPWALMLTPGNVADVTAAPELLARMGRALYVLGDKGYDADPLRQAGVAPVIPDRFSRKRKVRHDRERYKGRQLIETRSAVWRISVVWPPATISSPPTFCQASRSQPCSRSGCERVWSLATHCGHSLSA